MNVVNCKINNVSIGAASKDKSTLKIFDTQKVNRGVAKQIVEGQKPVIESMLARAKALAEATLPKLQAKATDRQEALLLPEVERMVYLQQVNPSVRPEELELIQQQYEEVCVAIEGADVSLDAIRVLVSVN